jgi:peptide/nickel transport system permease protein
VFWWPYYARIVRGEVRALMARPFIEAARLARVGPVRLMFRHLTPGLVPPVLVAATLDVGALVLILAGLSFIGLGAPPPSPELGAMAARGQQFLLTSWWVAVAPGVAVFVLALAANLAGDGVRDLVEA